MLTTTTYDDAHEEIFSMLPLVDTAWEQMALFYQEAEPTVYRDPEVTIRSTRNDYHPSDIRLSGRIYTDDQVGKLDGPGRDVSWGHMDGTLPKAPAGRTAKGSMTKRQRKAARKAERAAKRAALSACAA